MSLTDTNVKREKPKVATIVQSSKGSQGMTLTKSVIARYKDGREILVLDSGESQFNIVINPSKSSVALNAFSFLSSMIVDLTEADLVVKILPE